MWKDTDQRGIVFDAQGIIKAHELPEGWGLLELLRSATLRMNRQATPRAVDIPQGFALSLLRRVAEREEARLSAKAWSYAGRDLTLEELRDVAHEVVASEARQVESERQAAQHMAERTLKSPTELAGILAVIRAEFGWSAAPMRLRAVPCPRATLRIVDGLAEAVARGPPSAVPLSESNEGRLSMPRSVILAPDHARKGRANCRQARGGGRWKWLSVGTLC